MTSHIAECPCTEIPPPPPVPRRIHAMVWSMCCGANKKSPMQCLGSGHALLWFHYALRPYRSIRPAVDFVYLTYCVRLNPFCDLPTPIERVPLVSHLGSYFM